ncbi:MAG: radical SAM protein [Candidatus Omnitrophota bacterium]|jgi:MoaA/NifB/PqqE/SkfB family radical SAM enzyme
MAEDLLLKGILDGSRAFTGPETVQFDVTNRCNNNCLCCWNRSPLLGALSVEKTKEIGCELPFDVVKRVIEELKDMGTRTLFFAGGGEPFMHPDIMGILECAKYHGMKVCVNTNFTLLDEKRVKKIVELKVDHIHVSLLAGRPESYARMHPNKTEDTFYKLKELLLYAAYVKKKYGQHMTPPAPHINLYYVITNINFMDIKEMAELAQAVEADSVEFTPVDIIPGKTDMLLLDKGQIEAVSRDVRTQLVRLETYSSKEGHIRIFIEQCENFLKRIASPHAAEGKYEHATVPMQPCYTGWAFARINASGEVNPCLKASRICVGNIYQSPFCRIWNGETERAFREKSFYLDFKDTYFCQIGNDPGCVSGCLNSCDNIQINLDIHNKYKDILKKHGRI